MPILIEPSHFLADPQVRPFIKDGRQDLTAPNCPIASAGKYIIFSLRPPRGQVVIIKSMVPYAMERTDPGGPNESFKMLDPQQANGFFTFEPSINDAAPFIIESDFNAPEIQAGPPSANNRVRSRGISYISPDPWQEAHQSWFNPLFSLLVPGDTVFQMLFSIYPPSPINAMPATGQYSIGGVDGGKRVDFAGCMVVGQQMTEQYYHELEKSYGITRAIPPTRV